ncbi:hypothetical protein ABPG75_009428 [Micractinium tetrahymenae]
MPSTAVTPGSPHRRSLFVCAEDTAESAAACEWALKHFYKEGDVVHMTYVVTCLTQRTEVFHGVVGGSYSLQQSVEAREENRLLAEARARLEERFLPLLRPKLVPYQLHLYAEREDVGLQRVAQLLLQDIEQRDPALVILSAHNKPGSEEGLGSVAEFISLNCHRPRAIVRPHAQGQ